MYSFKSGNLTDSELSLSQRFGIDSERVRFRPGVRLGSVREIKKVVHVTLKHLLVPNALYTWNVLDVLCVRVHLYIPDGRTVCCRAADRRVVALYSVVGFVFRDRAGNISVAAFGSSDCVSTKKKTTGFCFFFFGFR